MKIRFAQLEDVPAMVELGQAMHDESPRYCRVPFDAVKAQRVATGLVQSLNGGAIVAEQNGEIIGMVAGAIVEHFFSQETYACDFVVYVAPKHRGSSAAYRMLKLWDETVFKYCNESTLGISTEVDAERTCKLYERLGYKLSGYILRKSYVRPAN